MNVDKGGQESRNFGYVCPLKLALSDTVTTAWIPLPNGESCGRVGEIIVEKNCVLRGGIHDDV